MTSKRSAIRRISAGSREARSSGPAGPTAEANQFQLTLELKRKKEPELLIYPYHQEIDQRRRRELRAEIRRQRLVAAGRPQRGVRHAVGRSMIRIGSRLASEPARQRARSL